MALSIISIPNKFYKTIFKIMTDGVIVGIILFGLLIYGLVTGFDDGSNLD